MGDRLSKRDYRTLHRTMESVVLTQFPNPERKGCPGTAVLHRIARKRIPMQDPALDHAARCSPCFAELTNIRRALHRQNVLWFTGTAAAAAVLIAVLISNLWIQKSALPTSDVPRIAALLDLRNASANRAVQAPGFEQNPIEIPRGRLKLTINLPIGSEAGSYEVQIRKPNQPATFSVKGQARIEDGITKLLIEIDTTSLPIGTYDFGWRMASSDWRNYLVLVR